MSSTRQRPAPPAFRNSLIGHTSGVKPRRSSAEHVAGQRSGRITWLSTGNELHANASASRSFTSISSIVPASRRRDDSENAGGYLKTTYRQSEYTSHESEDIGSPCVFLVEF